MSTCTNPCITPDEVQVISTLHRKLGDQRIVIIILGKMTISALLGGFTAKGVWHIGTESNTA